MNIEIRITHNGPFINSCTAPLFFNKTLRNIALAQPQSISSETTLADQRFVSPSPKADIESAR